MSADPIGPTIWVVVHGPGKARLITGPSGFRVWVRYAMMRGQLQSAWSEPQLVTIPDRNEAGRPRRGARRA